MSGTDDNKTPPLSPGEMALTQFGSMGANIPTFFQELLTALNMRKVMEGVVGDVVGGRGYKGAPSSTIPPEPSTRPAPTIKSQNGWVDPGELRPPPGGDHSRRIADHFEPHGIANPENPLGGKLREAMAKRKGEN